MKTKTFNQLRDARDKTQEVSNELDELAASLGHVGMHDLAASLGRLSSLLARASREIDEGSRAALLEHVKASEEATGNMVMAAIAAATVAVQSSAGSTP